MTNAVKFHISLNVADLKRSVDFYRVLFGSEPAKLRADYAKFESNDPPLVLSLEPTPPRPGGALNHVGFRLPDATALVDLQRRFEAAGMATQREEGVECCYALQTKFWLTDPDNNLWEFYLLHDDLEHRGAGQTLEQMIPERPSGAFDDDVPRPTVWQHRLGDDIPERLDFADDMVDEIQLEGTFNASIGAAATAALLAEAHRVLKPGGKLMIHTLVADRPLGEKPELPGPAALVESVPVDRELFAHVEAAGFVGIYLEKFGSAPCFVMYGAQMRELKLTAMKALVGGAADERLVMYRGPLEQVTDDAGNIYSRGQRVRATAEAWTMLRAGPASEDFVLLEAPQVVTLGCANRSSGAAAPRASATAQK